MSKTDPNSHEKFNEVRTFVSKRGGGQATHYDTIRDLTKAAIEDEKPGLYVVLVRVSHLTSQFMGAVQEAMTDMKMQRDTQISQSSGLKMRFPHNGVTIMFYTTDHGTQPLMGLKIAGYL